MQAGFIDWANGLASGGDVQVSYDSIEHSGSPLAAMVTVNNLRLVVQPSPAAAPLAITLPAFALEIDAAAPLLLHFDLPNRINISADRGDFVLTFGSIAQTERLDLSALLHREPGPFSAMDTQAQNIDLLASSGSLMVLHADAYHAHSTFNRHGRRRAERCSPPAARWITSPSRRCSRGSPRSRSMAGSRIWAGT